VIELVPYGAAARDALAAQLVELKAGDPLAPVTVLTASNYSGLSTRRALAALAPLVNVRFSAAARVAELLGGPALIAEGRRPLTPWIRLTAIRAALNESPGVFAEVAQHPSTARELNRVFEELRHVSPDVLTAVAGGSQRAADVVAMYRRFTALTEAFFDEVALLESAAREFERGTAAASETGPIVLYLPRQIRPALAAMLKRVAETTGTAPHGIFGLTGDAEVDAETETAAMALAGGPVRRADCVLPIATRIVSATEPEEEAREAIRQAIALARSGTPLHRTAFVYGSPEVYAGLLDDALSSAGVPHNGPSTRKLSQTIAGRTILGLPRIAASSGPGDPGFARDVVMEWLTGAPIWHAGREAPTHRWDDISREAGVVKGPAQWKGRLEYYAAAQELEASQRDPGEDAPFLRNAAWARGLDAFIQELRDKIGADERVAPSQHAQRAIEWLHYFLPEKALKDEAEIEARERVQRALEEIAAGHAELPAELDAPMSRTEFAAALEDAFSTAATRTGSLVDGIFCGSVKDAGEMTFDAIFVLGMVEGAFPSGSRDDPILTMSERARAAGDLPPGGKSPTEDLRAYLAALHSAPVRVLSTPRGDLRNQRRTQPSRWLLDAASDLEGQRLYATELGERLISPPGWFRVVNSFEAALRTSAEPASAQEWDLASLLRFRGRLDRHFLMRPAPGNALARGAAARRSRARRGAGRLDGWIGKVPAGAAPVPGSDRPISPTALEQFAACPFRYFLGHVLKVGEIERPEEVVTIAPATIGNIVHEVLENFFTQSASRPDPFADWSSEERAKLRELAFQSFEKMERQGLTGKDLTWRAEQARILRDLELLLDRELRERRRDGFQFQQAEAAFGMDPRRAGGASMPAPTLNLPNGERISFRGKVDRVDRGPGGELLVTDYKTGSTRNYESLNAENPLQGGKFLQLPVYALAFKGAANGAPVRARYWFISEQADFVSKEIELDQATQNAFANTVSTLVATMREGYFPAVPGDETFRPGRDTYNNCVYCPYDMLCPSAQRTESWEAAKRDPGLISFTTLATQGIATQEPSDA
jgi:RecB family exonuclease